MKLTPSRKACEMLGIHPNTLRKWADNGTIQHIRTKAGQRLYDVESITGQRAGRKICYCRVSSAKQRDDLGRQIESLRNAFPDHEVISDIGSGLNFKRKGLTALLEAVCRGDVREVVVLAEADKQEIIRLFLAKKEKEIKECLIVLQLDPEIHLDD